jgi:hypothetical protein
VYYMIEKKNYPESPLTPEGGTTEDEIDSI